MEMSLIPYSPDNIDLFWLHLGHYFKSIEYKFMYIYKYIVLYNFPLTHNVSKLFDYGFLRKLKSQLDNMICLDYPKDKWDGHYFEYHDKKIDILGIFYNCAVYFDLKPDRPERISRNKDKTWSFSEDDLAYIRETIFQLQTLCNFVLNEKRLKKNPYFSFAERRIKVLNKRIERFNDVIQSVDKI